MQTRPFFQMHGPSSGFSHLSDALARLDLLLSQAVLAFKKIYGVEIDSDPFRGLHISDEDVARLLAVEPGSPLLAGELEGLPLQDPQSGSSTSAMEWLKLEYGLSPFDLDVLLIALAPEIDLRYERLYAYLQDDVTRRRPSVDLALNLLCASGEEKLARRAHFHPEAPLIAHDLLRLQADPNQVHTPLLAQTLVLDEQVIHLLLGENSLDSRLAPFCQFYEPGDARASLPLDEKTWQPLKNLAKKAWFSRQPLWLYFQGQPGAGKRPTAENLARAVGASFLSADLALLSAAPQPPEVLWRLLLREARLKKAFVYLSNFDLLQSGEAAALRRSFFRVLGADSGVTLLAGSLPWQPDDGQPGGILIVPLDLPNYEQRKVCWQISLAAQGLAADPSGLEALAGRFRLNPGQVQSAAAAARVQVGLFPVARRRALRLPDAALFAAARAQSGHQLAALAQKIAPRYTFADIVLPEDALRQLQEICQRVALRGRVMDEWGFDHKLSLGKGLAALFAGPSGTGKTMAAEILAHELGLDLYRIDLSSVVSKYIGETEKNLNRIFEAAESANAVLFFDEADALFGKRSEVHDAHDRYANLEISYLLQKMDQFEGVAVLATNLVQNLDEAFIRRLAFTVYFPLPDEDSRRRIWQGIWPRQTPLDPALDPAYLAAHFKLSGGSIKNIAVGAAFLAAGQGQRVSMPHLLHAARREYQKIGKVLPESGEEG